MLPAIWKAFLLRRLEKSWAGSLERKRKEIPRINIKRDSGFFFPCGLEVCQKKKKKKFDVGFIFLRLCF